MDEVLARQQITQEVEARLRDEYAHEGAEARAEELVRARAALFVLVLLFVVVGVPALGLVLGVGVRLFLWASGI